MPDTAVPGGVPVIDIGPFLAGDPAGRARVAAEVGAACEDIGFLVITGHGVPADAIDDVYAATAAFFALPLVDKMAVASPHGDPFHGFAPMTLTTPGYSDGTEGADGGDDRRPADLREMYHVNRYDTPDEAIARGYPAHAVGAIPPNLWPAEPAGFVAAWRRYYACMEDLAATMLHIFAVALDMPEDHFDACVDHHLSNLAANCYPEQPTPPLPGQLRTRAHVDFSSLTILYQDDAPGGLQVHRRGRGWCDVPALPGSYVVNLGDLLARWTNDRWVATPHRVVNPPADRALTRRISIPFFHLPDYDAVIEAIPTCVSAANPARYRPVTAGEWTEARRLGRSASYGRIPAPA